MKIVKKIMSLTLMVIMVMLFIVPYVNAEGDTTTYSITITNNDGRQHDYKAYQILKGKVDVTTKKLYDLEWGTSVMSNQEKNLLDLVTPEKASNLNELGEFLNVEINAVAYAEDLSKDINKYFNTAFAVSTSQPETSYVFSDVVPGYYLISDTSSYGCAPRLVAVYDEDLSIDAKFEIPVPSVLACDKSFNKCERAINAGIGDVIGFKVIGYVPYDFKGKLTFKNTLSLGLTYENVANVFVAKTKNDGEKTELTVGWNVGVGDQINVEINTKEMETADGKWECASSFYIIIQYSATLNNNVNIAEGENSTVQIEYENVKYDDYPKEGNTESDVAKVFTTQVKVWFSDISTLAGGSVQISKITGSGTILYGKLSVNGQLTGWSESRDDSGTRWTCTDKTWTSSGFSKDVVYTVTYSNQGETVTANFKITDIEVGFEGIKKITYIINNDSEKSMEGDIVELPLRVPVSLATTGGIGTTIFYALGSLLIGLAVVVFINKKRNLKQKM